MIKTELRRLYLSEQRSLSPAQRTDKSDSIFRLFFAAADLGSVKILHCFIPIEKFNEIDTWPIFRQIWREYPGIKTVVPRVTALTGKMEAVSLRHDTDLTLNSWGILEPILPDAVGARSIDMVLVPALCFDRRGFRVGYGKGFYDRFLAECRENIVKIGLSYFEPIEEILDVGDHDVKLDRCITPDGIFIASTTKRRIKQ